MIVIDLCVF